LREKMKKMNEKQQDLAMNLKKHMLTVDQHVFFEVHSRFTVGSQ